MTTAREHRMAGCRRAPAVVALPGGLALTTALAEGGGRLLRESTSLGGDPAAAVTGLAALLAAVIAAWLTLCLGLALAARLPGAAGAAARRVRDRVTPVVVRRWAAVVLGASVTATVTPGTAVASVRSAVVPPVGPTGDLHTRADAVTTGDEPTTPPPGWAPRPSPTTLPAPGFAPTRESPSASRTAPAAPGWVPQRPTARDRSDPHLLTGRHRPDGDDRSVVVRRGDTLWSIAAARLGPEATDAEVARSWPQWYEANAAVIGPDPHDMRPGTLLTPPDAPTTSSRTPTHPKGTS